MITKDTKTVLGMIALAIICIVIISLLCVHMQDESFRESVFGDWERQNEVPELLKQYDQLLYESTYQFYKRVRATEERKTDLVINNIEEISSKIKK